MKVEKLSAKEKFFVEFSEELDVFDSSVQIPDWLFRFREQQLDSINTKFRRICRFLKDTGVDFKIKWPMSGKDGKWKFADIYIPKTDTVVLVASFGSVFRPMGVFSDRGSFFMSLVRRVWEIEDVRDLDRKLAAS